MELPVMIQQVLARAGTVYNDQQLQLLATSLENAKKSFADDDVGAAVEQLSKLHQLGPLGKLGSHAEIALEADQFAQTLIEQGQSALAAAKEKLQQEDNPLEGCLALMETRRLYIALPPLKEEILPVITETRTNGELRSTLKQAEKLDEARALMQKPAGKRRALLTLRRIATDDAGTPAASLAAEWIREHYPEESIDVPEQGASPPESGETHTWTSDTGHEVEAVLVGYGYDETTKAPYVVLKTGEGKQVTVPFARLSGDSQELAKELVRRMREAESKD